MVLLLPWLLNSRHSLVLVQNPDDRTVLETLGIERKRIFLIPGSGVDTDVLEPLPDPEGPITAGFAGRLLTDKGIRALVAAHGILRDQGHNINLMIAGNPDPANPASVSLAEAQAWGRLPGITWLGHIGDIRSLWRRCHIAVLPSHREGLPMSLLEAAAFGKPMIATDAPGCREIVIDGQTGLLVPMGDADAMASAVTQEQFEQEYARIWDGDEHWAALPSPRGPMYDWDPASTYVADPPFFDDLDAVVAGGDIEGARVLVKVGDSITTDHISPAGSIKAESPAGEYLQANGVEPRDFNSYGARRGNHQVMMRGTFANIRLRNELAPGTEGPWTTHLPSGEQMTVFAAAERYREERVPLAVLAGKEYGSGSSRDWAAKGPALLGVRFVIAESYERIHRSNLVGMGILPLQFSPGDSASSLGLTGRETLSVRGLAGGVEVGQAVKVEAVRDDGVESTFTATVRIDGAAEVAYFSGGGLLRMVLRDLLAATG